MLMEKLKIHSQSKETAFEQDTSSSSMVALESQLAEAEGPPGSSSYLPQTLWSSLTQAATFHSGRPAVVSMQQPFDLLSMVDSTLRPLEKRLSWSYRQLQEGADLLAKCLYHCGVRSGMSVAVLLHNCAEWSLMFWACTELRVTYVPLDPRSLSRKDEVRHYLDVIQPSVLVASDEAMVSELQLSHGFEIDRIMLKLVAESSSNSGFTLKPGWRSLSNLLSEPVNGFDRSQVAAEIEDHAESDEVLLLFTSGTSGYPKACVHTSKTLQAMSLAARYFQNIEPTDSLIQHLPCSHILACLTIIATWRAGGTVVIPGTSFNPETTLSAMDTEHNTYFWAVPSLYMALITDPSFPNINKSSVKHVGFAGAVISPELVHTAQNVFGTKVSLGFGMTEGAATISYKSEEDIVFDSGQVSVGKIAPGARAKICAAGQRLCLKLGEVGELHIGGDMVVNEYKYGSNDVFYCDDHGRKWLATGDQARMDANKAVYILGRYKDLVIRAGENLSSALIEASLNKVDGVTVR